MNHNEIIHKTQDLLYDPQTTIRDLAEIISEDESLTDRLIRLIKSYGFPPEAWNVRSAIIVLGFGAIRTIIAEQAGLRSDY